MRPLPIFVLLVGLLLFGASGAIMLTETVFRQDEAALDGGAPIAVDLCEDTRRSRLRGAACGLQALGDGIFRSAPLDVPALMPAAPDGWTRHAFALTDAETLTGRTWKKSVLSVSTANELMDRLQDAASGRRLSATATYRMGDRTMILALAAEMKAIRKAEDGKIRAAHVPQDRVAMTLDGVPVWTGAPFDVEMTGGKRPVSYHSYHADLDGLARITVLSDAAEADVVALLSRIDVAALQEGLPVQTAGYTPGDGLRIRGDAPAAEPMPPMPWHAQQAIDAGRVPDGEGDLFAALADGRLATWSQLYAALGPDRLPSDALTDLMGPAPAPVVAGMAARGVPLGPDTPVADREALAALQSLAFPSQRAFRAEGHDPDALSPGIAALVAILPETTDG